MAAFHPRRAVFPSSEALSTCPTCLHHLTSCTGADATRVCLPTSTTSGSSGRTSPSISWPAARGLHAGRRLSTIAAVWPNYDPETNTLQVAGYGDTPSNLGVESYWLNFNPRTGISWRLSDSNVVRGGLRRERGSGRRATRGHILPDQRRASNSSRDRIPSRLGRLTGDRYSGAFVRPIPDNGILPATGRCCRRALTTSCSTRAIMGSCTRGTSPTSGRCLAPLRLKWRTSATGPKTTGLAKTSMRATPLGADQRRPAALREVRPNREYNRAGQGRASTVQVSFDAGQGRPPHAGRLDD